MGIAVDDLELTSVIAQRLREARERAGLTQAGAAAKLGLPRTAITEVELGRRKVTAVEVVRLAEMYGVRVEWILGGDREQPMPILRSLTVECDCKYGKPCMLCIGNGRRPSELGKEVLMLCRLFLHYPGTYES